MFRNFGGVSKFCGPIVTVQCFEDNSPVKAAVDAPGEGRVQVVGGGGSLRRALLGGKLGAAAARNGWPGVVINGCARDVAELALCLVGIRRWLPCRCRPKSVVKASRVYRFKSGGCGCGQETGCMPTRMACWLCPRPRPHRPDARGW